MARTFDSQRLRHQRAMDRRLAAEHRQLARSIAAIVLRAAGPDGTIPNRRTVRAALSGDIWVQAVKPYYVGRGDSPLRGPVPQSPYARLLYDGVAGATRIQAERQAALLRRVVRDRTVLAWLTGPRLVGALEMRITELNRLRPGEDPLVERTLQGAAFDVSRLVRPRGMYDPWHLWVDPNGYRLSDRIWRTSIEVRSRVDALLDYHIARGTAAVDMADLLEEFLTPAGRRPRTTTPYGVEGSYSARRLARTEITAAAGRATVNASAANPFVGGLQWRLSASHPRIDICDEYARGGPNHDGVYPVGETPQYPAHPQCLCSLLPVPAGDMSGLIASLRQDIQAARGDLVAAAAGGNADRARTLQGLLNPDYLTRGLLSGSLEDAIMAAVAAV